MKKIISIVLAISLLIVSFVTPVVRVSAKTLGEMKKELNVKIEEYDNIKHQQELTKEEQENVKKQIKVNENKLYNLRKDMDNLSYEIAKLNKSIAEKDAEIKEIMNYLQLSEGESAYLEYIFGATDFTDFIYRSAIAEQLSKYNSSLIDEYNKEIEDSKKKQNEINNKQNEISNIQEELRIQSIKLGQEISNLGDDMLTQEQEVRLLKMNILELQTTYKCSDDEDIEVCKKRAQENSYIPPSTGAFKRPINYAIVTANYGMYDPYHTGNPIRHAGMDLAGNSGTSIYAAAPGKVVSVTHNSCGNNVVYIVHNINGVRYTTGYWHMRSANVRKGDLVTENTVVGIQGGKSYEDSCSTGEHLDFVVTRGAYTIDYFGNPRSISVDPRNYIYFPPLITNGYVGIGRSEEWTTR